jgi:hypothetical protein
MKRFLATLSLLALAACDGNPLANNTTTNPGTGTSGCAGVSNSTCLGEVNRFVFDPNTDTLSLNNLPLDLNGTYARDNALESAIGLTGFRAYRNTSGAGNYVALYRTSGAVQAGVVGSDSFLGYGNGGVMYGSNSTAVLPVSGQATYIGDYAGIRVYEGTGTNLATLGYATGTASTLIDFNDFDNGGAIYTTVTNRVAYDTNGNAIGALPSLSANPTKATDGRLTATNVTEVGANAGNGAGTLQGVFGGSGGTQIAGVLVITGADPLGPGRNVQESGAFLLVRNSFIP